MIIKENSKEKITAPKQIADIVRAILKTVDETDTMKEHLYSIGMNCQHEVIYIELVSLGTLNESLIHPREVFKTAVMKSAYSIALAHNHPSGSNVPSLEDIQTMERVSDAGKILGIEVLDHVIVTDASYGSIREQGGLK